MGSCLSRAQSQPTLPSLKGKLSIVTGANGQRGIGYITALELGRAGSAVIVCARDSTKGEEAVNELKKVVPDGLFESAVLDLSDLTSVRNFVTQYVGDRPVNLLVNNAGVMNIPTRELSKDGFEMQLATNFIGHYALSALLLPSLRKAGADCRVVNVSSIRANDWRGLSSTDATIEFVRDPVAYDSEYIYSESKALNLILNNEMARRCRDVKFVACHPGVCATNLFRHKYGWVKPFMQTPEMGALASIRAATEADAVSGTSYYGPNGWYGDPVSLPMPPLTTDPTIAKRYFDAVEKATGIIVPQ